METDNQAVEAAPLQAGQEKWLSAFDERQRKEIEFCRLYARQFAHGTEGHNAKLIIARMADMLGKLTERSDAGA